MEKTSGTFPVSPGSFLKKKFDQQNKEDEKLFLNIQKNDIEL